MLFVNPVFAISHVTQMIKYKKSIKKQEKEKAKLEQSKKEGE